MKKMLRYSSVLLAVAGLISGGCSSDDSSNSPANNEPEVTVRITSPVDSAIVSVSTTISVSIENAAAEQVSLFVDAAAEPVAVDSTEPFSLVWNVVGYEDGSSHELYVQAALTDGSVATSTPIQVTVDNSSARPAAVNFREPQNVTASSLTLNWQQSSATDFAEYRIYVADHEGVTNNSELLATITERSQVNLTVDHEFDNVTRYYRVYVYDEVGLYSGSAEFAATTLNLPPTAPQLGMRENLSGLSVELTWEASTAHDFDHYEIHRGTGLGVSLSDQLVFSSSSANTTSFVDQSISTLTSYCYLLTVFDTGGLSSSSAMLTAELPSRDGLQALWTFDEAEGFYVLDGSGHDRSVTRHNGAHVEPGKVGSALVFDGKDDYAYFPPLYSEPPSELTVSVWAAADTAASKCLIYHAEHGEWALSVDPDDSLTCSLRFGNGQWRIYSAEISADTDWHHYAMVYIKGVGVAAYLDGDSLGMMVTAEMDLWPNGTEDASSLGSFQRGCNQNNYFGGKLDEVRIYTRALSSTEIKMLSQQ